jgi:hypothetical protein
VSVKNAVTERASLSGWIKERGQVEKCSKEDLGCEVAGSVHRLVEQAIHRQRNLTEWLFEEIERFRQIARIRPTSRRLSSDAYLDWISKPSGMSGVTGINS